VEKFEENVLTDLFSRMERHPERRCHESSALGCATGRPGTHSLNISPQVGGGVNTGGHLYKLLSPGVNDTLYVRYYVKYPANGALRARWHWMGGHNPPVSCPTRRLVSSLRQRPLLRGSGADRRSDAFRIIHYWMNMRVAGDGQYWATRAEQPECEGDGRPMGVCRADGETGINPLPRSTASMHLDQRHQGESPVRGPERHVERRQLHRKRRAALHSKGCPLCAATRISNQIGSGLPELFAKRSCGPSPVPCCSIMSWSRRATSGAWPPQHRACLQRRETFGLFVEKHVAGTVNYIGTPRNSAFTDLPADMVTVQVFPDTESQPCPTTRIERAPGVAVSVYRSSHSR
jgi:hypothetical protein